MDAEGISPPPRTRRTIRAVRVIRLACIAQATRVGHTGHISYLACSGNVVIVNHVDNMNPTPLYIQLADILREMINSGELEPRSPVPSESYLQQEQGVARGTVRQAMRVLRDEGLVVTIGGRGTFVVGRDPKGK